MDILWIFPLFLSGILSAIPNSTLKNGLIPVRMPIVLLGNQTKLINYRYKLVNSTHPATLPTWKMFRQQLERFANRSTRIWEEMNRPWPRAAKWIVTQHTLQTIVFMILVLILLALIMRWSSRIKLTRKIRTINDERCYLLVSTQDEDEM